MIPVSVDLSDLSRDAVSSLQSRALDAVNATVNCLPRLDAFSLWHVVLPKSPKSPYRRCLLDLVSTAHPQLRLKALAVVHSFVSRTGGFFSQVKLHLVLCDVRHRFTQPKESTDTVRYGVKMLKTLLS